MEGGLPTPKKTQALTPEQRQRWNDFTDFVEKQNMKGNPQLDQRNKQIGMGLLQKFNMAYPDKALPVTIIPQVQQELQDHRTKMVTAYRAGQQFTPDVKSEDDIMKNISLVDGWPGTKTLASKFPIAIAHRTDEKGTTTKNYGTDLAAFEAAQKKQ